MEAAFLQEFEQRNPVDASRFHGDGGDAAGAQPVRQHLEIPSERSKSPHRLLVPIVWDSYVMEFAVDVDPRGVGMHRLDLPVPPLSPARLVRWITLRHRRLL